MKHDSWIFIRRMNTFLLGLAAIAGLLLTPFQTVIAGTDSYETQITALLGKDDTPVLAMVSGKTVYATPLIRQMYRHDGYHLIWKDTAITSFSAALEGLEADGLTPGDYRFAEIDPLLDASKRDRLTPDKRVEADILLTEAFLRAVYHLFFGKADPERIDADINFARTYADKDAMPVLLAYIRQGKIDAAFDWARPKSKYYQWLKVGLDRYRSYRTAGGWSSIPAGDALKPGLTDPRVATLRKRLAVTADLPADGAETNDTAVFDPQLEAAVKVFQKRHGLEADGIVGPDTLNAMNVPVSERIEQIRVNLERGRWILHEAYEEYLVADIAGFQLFWATGEEIIWMEQIQVGKAYTKTPVFKGEIRYLDFNPTWTIPPGILKRSVIPGLKRDPDYLSKKGYHLLTPKGQPVDPKTVDWKALKGFPYIVRQPAGPNNALGQVKFLFPNPHYVFLHDTNHRELFDRTKRTFSSGCIRVRNPMDLAERLLAGQENWTRKRIEAVVASGKTTRVILKRPMRILIAYNTARVPTAGSQVYFREDIYQRDAAVLAALEGPFRLHRRDEK